MHRLTRRTRSSAEGNYMIRYHFQVYVEGNVSMYLDIRIPNVNGEMHTSVKKISRPTTILINYNLVSALHVLSSIKN